MANADVTITVETRVVGLWRAKAATWVLRLVRPTRLALWLARWLVSGLGADVKVGSGKWERGPRAYIKVSA